MIDLVALGLNQEQLQDLVASKVANALLAREEYGEDSREEVRSSRFFKAVNNLVRDEVDAAVRRMAETSILPMVGTHIEGVLLQETNNWGQAVGEPMTFLEYLTQRAEHYLTEPVDYEGKSQAESNGYSFKSTQSRIAHMVDRHLHYAIETAMKDALVTANSALAEGIEATVKMKLREISNSIKVVVKK